MGLKQKILLSDRPMAAIEPMIGHLYEPVPYWDFDGPEALVKAHPDIQVIATHGGLEIPRDLVEAMPRLGLIISVGAGYDGIDVDHARARGIEVANGAGINAGDVAELAVAMLLQLVIPLRSSEAELREGRWTKGPPGGLRLSLSQRRVGIVGMGHIGQALAERLAPFGCPIAWHGPRPKPVPWRMVERLEDLASESDVLIVAAMLNDDTRHLIDGRIIALLGGEGLLINISRGGLVDERALIEALCAGRLAGAALDVFEMEPTPASQWRNVPNILLTPHIGGQGTAGFSNLKTLLLENLARFFAGDDVLTPVG